MAKLNIKTIGLIAGGWLLFSHVAIAQQTVTLEQALELARINDPWHKENRLRQTAIEHRSVAAGELPDPAMSLSVLNLPLDSWEINQEPMTQLRAGVSQMFPRGDTLALNSSRLKIEAERYPLLRENRVAQVAVTVAQLWLEAFQAHKVIELIESDRALFEQMVDVARTTYSSAFGRTRQHDVIRAQLELVQLEDRLTDQAKNRDVALAQLDAWLSPYEQPHSVEFLRFDEASKYTVANSLPDLIIEREKLLFSEHLDVNDLAQILMHHPAIKAIDVKYQASQKKIDIANQGYKPQWGINASYSYRDDDPNGSSRADFFSLGVTMDLPLFTEDKQDKEVSASVAEAEAIKTEKLLILKSMLGNVQSLISELKRLKQRAVLYQSQLLQQSKDQASAALNAYTNDDGDFAEVVRAKIAELNMRIAKLKIDVAIQQSTARLNYFLAQSNTSTYSEVGIGEQR